VEAHKSERRNKSGSLLASPACKIAYEHFRHETSSKEDPTASSKTINMLKHSKHDPEKLLMSAPEVRKKPLKARTQRARNYV
jgi:hypothetical protein